MSRRQQPVYRYGHSEYESDRYDHYGRQEDRYDYYDGGGRHETHNQYGSSWRPNQRDDMYNFQGARASRDSYRPSDFTFQSSGPPAPRFPAADVRREYPPPPQQSQRSRREQDGNYGSERRRGSLDIGRRGRGGRNRGNGRGGLGSRAAFTRDILHNTRRGNTPEQMSGMNDSGQVRFNAVESSDEADDDGEVSGSTRSPREDQDAPRKRVKPELQNNHTSPVSAKWTNPDPYTSLPPPETLGAPKKDLVQVIRKAKVEQVTKAEASDAVTKNADFISFDSGEHFNQGKHYRSDSESDHSEADHGPSAINLRELSINKQTGGKPHPLPTTFQPIDRPVQSNARNVRSPSPPPGRGMKRKRDEQPTGLLAVSPVWRLKGGDPTPWYTVDLTGTLNAEKLLDQEISDFFEFFKPLEHEEQLRRDLIDRVQIAVRKYPRADDMTEVKSFGSFAAGIYLPLADMDLVAISPDFQMHRCKTLCQKPHEILSMSTHIKKMGLPIVRTLSAVTKARVPLVKFTDKLTNIKVDVSFENNTGLNAVRTFLEWKEQFPVMPKIVVLIKQMLAMRDLNEVHTGGIGGFTTICLVVSMLQNLPELQSSSTDPNQDCGRLLLAFLNFYGNDFNFRQTGITMDPPGYYDKIRRPRPGQNNERLTIIDPNNPTNDISGGSKNVQAIFKMFRLAHVEIQNRMIQASREKDYSRSILGCILGGDYGPVLQHRRRLQQLSDERKSKLPPPSSFEDRGKQKPDVSQHSVRHEDVDNRGSESVPPDNFQPSRQEFPLPPRPATNTHPEFPLPPRPTTPPHLKRGRQDAPPQDKSKYTKGTKKDRSDMDRAKTLRREYPDVHDIPDKLSKKSARKFKKYMTDS